MRVLRYRTDHGLTQSALADGAKAPVIARIWALTVACPNPVCNVCTGAVCVACGTAVPLPYVRAGGKAGRIGARPMAVATVAAEYLVPGRGLRFDVRVQLISR